MKHIPVFIFPALYALVFGVLISQGVFYFYDEEAAGLLYFLSVGLFSLLGGTCLSFFILLKATNEVDEDVNFRLDQLEQRVSDIEYEQLVAKYPELVATETTDKKWNT